MQIICTLRAPKKPASLGTAVQRVIPFILRMVLLPQVGGLLGPISVKYVEKSLLGSLLEQTTDSVVLYAEVDFGESQKWMMR